MPRTNGPASDPEPDSMPLREAVDRDEVQQRAIEATMLARALARAKQAGRQHFKLSGIRCELVRECLQFADIVHVSDTRSSSADIDEPLTALDRHARALLKTIVADHLGSGGLMLAATHELSRTPRRTPALQICYSSAMGRSSCQRPN